MQFCAREDIRSGRLQNIAQYLESRRGQDGVILRAAIDPVIDIPRDASLLMLVEQASDRRQRVRLVGTKAAEILGGDFTGRWLADLVLKAGSDWPPSALEQVFASHAMFFGRLRLPWDLRAPAEIEWLAVHFGRPPVTEDAGEADKLAILAFDQHDRPAGS